MGKSADVLKANLVALKNAERGPAGQLAYAKKAGVGEGTVSRARRGESNTTLESLDSLARAVRLEAWQLLVPGFDPLDPPRAVTGAEMRPVEVFDVKISIAALELARVWEQLPLKKRQEFHKKIVTALLTLDEKEADAVPDSKLRHLAAPGTPTRRKLLGEKGKAGKGAGATPRQRKSTKHDQ